MRVCICLLLLTACSENGVELSVDLRTDFIAGLQFVGTRTEILSPSGEVLVSRDAVAASSQNYLVGERVADFDGLEVGTSHIRLSLLGPSGRVIAMQETLVELRTNYAVTVLVTSNCRDIICPLAGGDASLNTCVGGICVDPRCTPETPEHCGEAGCITDDQCSAGSACTTGSCIDGYCFLRVDSSSCGSGFVCDIDEGCLLELGGDAGMPDACPPAESDCTDGRDGDCDGLIDCADDDCADVACDDETVCTSNDRCTAGVCSGDTLDCSDDNECTDDVCDAATGCSNSDNVASCDDGSWCNGTDVCEGGTCTHVDPPCAEFCSEVTMACEQCRGAADCGDVTYGDWGDCAGFSDVCDIAGEQTRTVMTPSCNGGSCTVAVSTELRSCSRTTSGTTCGSTTVSPWGACGGYANACDTGGTQSRTTTTRTCSAGSCQPNGTSGSRACNRTVNDGTLCGSFWQRCCAGSCQNLADNNSHCGACRVACSGGTSCSANNGGYACGGCSFNSTCQSIYNPSATCWTNRCNCQCPTNGVCADGGCGAGFYCHDVSGNNYCSPSP